MRQAIGGTWVMQLVITFTFLFAAFLALSINYSRAFKIKNETLSIIEKGEGVTNDSVRVLSNYLNNNGYRLKGRCPKGSYGVIIGNSTPRYVDNSQRNTQFSYCLFKVRAATPNFPDRAYYEIKLFFRFNVPVLGDIFKFNVDGQTKDVNYPADGKCEVNDTRYIMRHCNKIN